MRRNWRIKADQKEIEVQFNSELGHIKSGVSNTRPAGRMWPARCVFAARDIIKITQIIAETTYFVV